MKLSKALPAALLAGGLLLTGCGNDENTASEEPKNSNQVRHNAADVEFATAMIPHHRQAIEMADVALDKAENADVRKLAEDIKAAQNPEIERMSTWLRKWDEPVPPTSMDSAHSGHDMGGMEDTEDMPGMEGMMSAEDMEMLEQASGAAFDKHWVEMMIEHHEGAVTMSETELDNGSASQAKQLAQRIIDGQTEEIQVMEKLLPELG